MTLTSSNIFSDAYSQIKAFIDTNIDDPKNRYKKQWVHPAEPNITSQRFDGYPFIVVNVDVSEDMKSFDRSTSNKTFRILLSVYSDEATQVDSVSDEIISKFKDETITDSMADFKSIEVASSPFVMFVLGGKKIYRREIGMMGVKRI